MRDLPDFDSLDVIPVSIEPDSNEPAEPVAGPPRLKDGIYALDPDYYASYGENAWRMLTGPLRFERDDWLKLAAAAGITGALFLADESLRDVWQDDLRNDGSDFLADATRDFGHTPVIVGSALGVYAISEAFGLKREKAVSLMVLESFLLTALTIDGMKYVTGRERPNKADSAFDFEGPLKGDTNASFPSGHAGHAFSVASVIAEVYGEENPWVPWVSYGLATATAFSRINDNKHWFSDVFVGSALGLAIGKMVTRFNPFLERNDLEMVPLATAGAQGVGMRYQF